MDARAEQRLKVFLYILLRDHLTSGYVEGIIKEHVNKIGDGGIDFTNSHLAEYSEDLVERILEDEN